ncbi:MAG: hypothetical protein DHS20C19_19360 [Acidimicrobiales bacterium]|nr:MAG: hypothetical protein DHS20C19_19360 [Acidimicrobiales bacterium]
MTEIPAGWYDDPENATQFRYWDGTVWTDHRAPKAIKPSMANADATAVISRGFDLLKETWTRQLAIAALAMIGMVTGGAMAVAGFVSGLDPNPFDIIDRVTQPGFDADRFPEDQAYLDSITFDWAIGPLVLMIVGALIAYATVMIGFAVATVFVGAHNRGTERSLGESFSYAIRRVPRWVGIVLLWGLVSSLALAALVGLHILLIAVSTAFLVLLIPIDIALMIYAWPYGAMAGVTLILSPRDRGPFRRTVDLVKPRWPGIAGRVLLVNLVVFGLNFASNIVALVPILGLVVVLVMAFAIYGYQIATNVALYEYLGGPLDPELEGQTS